MKGFVISAQNTRNVNYLECAEALALNLKQVMPDCNITLISNDISMCNAFDNVVELPYGDLAMDSDWKLINDWQVYEASPYDYTIKLEADMYIPNDISYLFDMLDTKDVLVCTNIRDYRGNISSVRAYRQFIDDNKLPDVYNAITCFKKSETAESFFRIVKDVFENWDKYRKTFICNNDEPATTDWAYSIACCILGVENTTIPNLISMVHMKQYINNTFTEDWTKEFIYEFGKTLKIQTFPQKYPVHYHIKGFGKIMKEHYGRIQTVL
jgi:hypothetical protein